MNSFFRPIPEERIFQSTLCLAPSDRRGTSRGSFQMLRKPKRNPQDSVSQDPRVRFASPPVKQPEHEAMLSHAGRRWKNRSVDELIIHDDDEETGDAEGGAAAGSERQNMEASQQPADASSSFWRYDSTQHCWIETLMPPKPEAQPGPLSSYRKQQATSKNHRIDLLELESNHTSRASSSLNSARPATVPSRQNLFALSKLATPKLTNHEFCRQILVSPPIK